MFEANGSALALADEETGSMYGSQTLHEYQNPYTSRDRDPSASSNADLGTSFFNAVWDRRRGGDFILYRSLRKQRRTF